MIALVSDTEKTILTQWPKPEITEGEVLIEAKYSGLNYKDALGITRKGTIFKTLPIVGGIDVAGVVAESKSSQFKVGDAVLVTGCGLGETHDGGYAEFVKEHESAVVHLPKNLSIRESMIYGTAGFTACLALERMLQNGQVPDMGPIVVTGASGGVGQFSIQFFSKTGFEVIAVSGKPEMSNHLRALGAAKVVSPDELDLSQKPLNKARYGGVVDNVGGQTLSALVGQVNLWGNVACIGLAGGHEIHSSVMPLILRGVSLLGTSSNNTSRSLREKIWHRLSEDLKPTNLDLFVTQTLGLENALQAAEYMLDRRTHGRTLLQIEQK